jgi:hypothetical protein
VWRIITGGEKFWPGLVFLMVSSYFAAGSLAWAGVHEASAMSAASPIARPR